MKHTLEDLALFLIGLLLTPFVYVAWLRWRRRERAVLCDGGEGQWIDDLEDQLSDRSADA